MINQAVIDALACLMTLLIENVNDIEMAPPGIWREIFCKLWTSTFIMWGVTSSSIYNLMFLTIERYYAILKPLAYDTEKVFKRLPFILMFAWVMGFIVSIPTGLFFQLVDQQCVLTVHLRFPFLYEIMTPYFMVVNVFFPATVMIYAYIKMGLSLGQSQFASIKIRQAQVNLFQTCVILMLVFVLTGVNLCTAIFLYYVGVYPDVSNDQYHISVVLVVFNSCVNPYIYCVRYKEFQDQLKYLIFRKVDKNAIVENQSIKKSVTTRT